MAKILIDIPDDLLGSFNEMADLYSDSSDKLIMDILEKLIYEYREYRVELDRLNDDSGIYRNPPPKVPHFSIRMKEPTFKIIMSTVLKKKVYTR